MPFFVSLILDQLQFVWTAGSRRMASLLDGVQYFFKCDDLNYDDVKYVVNFLRGMTHMVFVLDKMPVS